MHRRPADTGFAAATIIVVPTLIVLVALGAPGRGQSDRPSTRKTVVADPPTTTTSDTAAIKHPAQPVAQRFIRAFLRYETGDVSPSVTRVIRATATRSLARRLLGEPPRPIADRPPPTPGQLKELKVHDTIGHAQVSFTATIDYGHVTGALGLTFTRTGARWRLTDVQ